LSVKEDEVVEEGPRWRVGNGLKIKICHDLWSTVTDTDTIHDTDTNTSTQLLIWKNYIIQC